MNRVKTPPVAMPKLALVSANVGAPVPSFVTNCQRVSVPRWKPTQLMAMASPSVETSALVEL